jgi:hypothetical protein
MIFKLDRDVLTPDLKRMVKAVDRPRSIFEAGAKACQIHLKKWMRTLQARGNEKGWPSQKFFAGGKNSVEKNIGIARVDDRGAVITIADYRFVHRITGGTVTAKRKKFLAIPLTAEAYALGGKGTLRESAPDLVVIRTPRGTFLARSDFEKVKGKGKGMTRQRLTFLFRLVRSVTHKGHPNEMPVAANLAADVRAGMLQAADILIRAGRTKS